MPPITIQNAGVSFGDYLFRNLTFVLNDRDRIGVVGNNGAGKTTLLRCIAGLQDTTEGSISRPRNTRVGLVEQTIPAELTHLTLREALLDAFPPDERDASSWRADALLDAFGAPDDMRERKLSHLSGGWQRLALLGRVWNQDPDVLIIDEPTNHLDLHKIILLEKWMIEEVANTTLVMVSHDRRFLETCTNRTLFLRPVESKLYRYPFMRARELLTEDDRVLQSKVEREQKELHKLRKSAHNLRQIGVNNYSDAALKKSVQIAKRADMIEDAIPEAHVEQRREIRLVSRETHANRILKIRNLIVSRPDGVPLFKIGELDVLQGDRVVILGRNGTGKTQFVRTLLAEFALSEAAPQKRINISPSVKMGYIDQNLSQLLDTESLSDHISRIGNISSTRATALLVGAGFPVPKHAHRIATLSPGQKARLALLSLRLLEPNFYLMDEPTNHLDITGQEQFEKEILNHVASAIFVSHDRAFVNNIGNRFLVVDGESVLEIDSPEVFYKALAENLRISDASPRSSPI